VVNQQEPGSLIVIAGDFNLPRHSWLYDEFVEATGVIDPLNGYLKPTYYPMFSLPDRYHQPIDHIFVRPPAGFDLKVSAELLFEQAIPLTSGALGRVSDHAGVQLNLQLQPLGIYASELVNTACSLELH
jgi:hypothetical protein